MRSVFLALVLVLAAPVAASEPAPCLWSGEDLECAPPNEMSADDIAYYEAKSEAALRLAGCKTGETCKVLHAPLAIEAPDWALAPMPWLSSTSTDADPFYDPSEPWEE